MTLKINLYVPSVSLSSSRVPAFVNGRLKLVASPKAAIVRKEVARELSLIYRKNIKEYLKKFNPCRQAIHATINFIFPSLYAKNGEVASSTPDCTDIARIITEEIFNPAHVDPRHVAKLTIEKSKGGSQRIEIEIEILNRRGNQC